MEEQRVKKGYKLTDIGVIPDDWDVKKLGEIAVISSGGTPNRSNPLYWNGHIPWITTSQIDFNVVNSSDEFITELGLKNSSTKMYEKESLLMAMYGQGKTRGKIAILGIKATINQACASISLNKNISNQYIFFNLSHRYEEIRKLSNTGNQENLNGNIIKSILIPLPPLSEQQKIAEVLSDVDKAIAALERLLTKKRNIKQGTMQLLLTGKKRLSGFTGEWEVKKLGDICDFTQGIQIPQSEQIQYPRSGYIRYLYIRDFFTDDYQWFVKDQYPNKIMSKLDIMMVNTGNTAGKVYSGSTGVLSNNAFKITFNYELDRDYLLVFLKSPSTQLQIQNFFNLAGQPHVGHKNIYQLIIALPPLPEQKAIANVLSDMDKEIEKIEKQRDKYKQIKQGMMQELLTGKTRIV